MSISNAFSYFFQLFLTFLRFLLVGKAPNESSEGKVILRVRHLIEESLLVFGELYYAVNLFFPWLFFIFGLYPFVQVD